MLKQKLLQKGKQKLSPQQIKLMKLVQLSTLDFEQRVKQELEENPALEMEEDVLNSMSSSEEDENSDISENMMDSDLSEDQNSSIDSYEINIDEYLSDDEILDFKNNIPNQNYSEKKYIPIVSGITFQEYLKNQLHTFRFLNKEDLLISDFIIGNIDENGYIRRNLPSIVDDIFLILGISVTEEKIEKLLLNYIQKLDPIGIGARDLQECILLQLENKKKSPEVNLAKDIIQNNFEFFTKKHYQKLQNKLRITRKNLRKAIDQIEKLNPKPGKIYSENTKNLDHLIPDFTICIVDGKLELSLNHRNTPELKISSLYLDMLRSYKYSKGRNLKRNDNNTIFFIKQKIDSAKWFVDSIKQRQNTLMLTMNAIMDYQKEYFFTGDPYKIKPMILKNISQKIGVGISTVSRVANSKYVNTPYGTFLIKSFFSEKMINEDGKEISSIEIKKLLGEYIEKENKKRPLTDEKLSKILKKKGYIVARRTVAKYRNKMKISVSRMRKIL
ncbi:RNA polymerase sigma-54 factor [Blattabacterium sp. (Cryptocercus kyebangensis)]|uniref:RNA polymerase factor sigma-54 n=1 Tax=Blattabacterium sp. (Cryptocercus kyebangensis) TaxID=298656 RepID=UPI000D7C8607|nr:RNA polymerase factor sigma-54 [Blattabacterium sp. (Cryptocercus kyebangensis)]AWU43576.1 RNA polymerase sigma-54 factor [Blattabacterium sp. (Cryptocercus kyebangensis)]